VIGADALSYVFTAWIGVLHVEHVNRLRAALC
jgi:hypothetical protein